MKQKHETGNMEHETWKQKHETYGSDEAWQKNERNMSWSNTW
jgi:hypothetical protein